MLVLPIEGRSLALSEPWSIGMKRPFDREPYAGKGDVKWIVLCVLALFVLVWSVTS